MLVFINSGEQRIFLMLFIGIESHLKWTIWANLAITAECVCVFSCTSHSRYSLAAVAINILNSAASEKDFYFWCGTRRLSMQSVSSLYQRCLFGLRSQLCGGQACLSTSCLHGARFVYCHDRSGINLFAPGKV